jgi:cysteine desulfurase
LGHHNTEQEIDYILEVLPEVVEKLRQMSPLWEKVEKK